MKRAGGVLLLVALAACTSSNRPEPESDSTSGWEMASPSSVGLDPDPLQQATDDIAEGQWGNVHALVVVRNGKLVHEAYFSGQDELWFEGYRHVEYGPSIKHGLRSASKSFTSTVVGVALDRGLIPSVDTRLRDLLPTYDSFLTGSKSDITLRHVLTMSAGLHWVEGAAVDTDAEDDQYRLQESEDPVAIVLSRELDAPPGSTFNYSGGLTQVLAAVVESATGTPFLEYADSVLLTPLAIEDWEWFSLGNSTPAAWTGLRLTARDMAKLGQLYLEGGVWNGQTLVSAGWVRSALEPTIDVPGSGSPEYVIRSAYGFQWWYDLHEWNGAEIPFHSAMGNGGQRVIVIPDLDLVVAVFAGFYEDPDNSWTPEAIVRQYVLPAIATAGLDTTVERIRRVRFGVQRALGEG